MIRSVMNSLISANRRSLRVTCALASVTVLLLALAGCSSSSRTASLQPVSPRATSPQTPVAASVTGPTASSGGTVAPVTTVARTVGSTVTAGGSGSGADGSGLPAVSAAPVAIHQTVRYQDGVTARIVGVRQSRVTAVGPGERTGQPMTTFTVSFRNGSATPLPLERVVVEVTYGPSGDPAAPVYDGSQTDFSSTVAPGGGTATARYSFSIPVEQLAAVTVRVRFDDRHTSAVFSGKATQAA